MKRLALSVCLAACMLSGCGGESVKIAPVSGVIKKDGKPLEGATVTFRPVETTEELAPASFGVTDANGRYTLETAAGEEGAFIGKHRVSISKVKDAAANDDSVLKFEDEVPPGYDQLEFEVTADGTEKANWDVKSN